MTPEKRLEQLSTTLPTGWVVWLGQVDKDGYGRVVYQRKVVRAHRLSYLLHIGEIPDGLFVLHTCDNPDCINPDHLFLGTPKDNMVDKMRKGRGADLRGEKNSRAKLSTQQVLEIRKDKRAVGEVAKAYGVSHGLISGIKTKTRWSHI